ncbi:hypothetical protein U0070_014866 [Myodes glareolus]|uniref:Uncharacterized protein n=1 Tax=Myodes glareolus TaxID=447135 RepID=A0AAW0IEG3_MYOGA
MTAIVSKEEMVSLTDKLHALESLMMALEHNTGQEIQDLQKAMVSRFNKIEEIIDSDEQEQKDPPERTSPPGQLEVILEDDMPSLSKDCRQSDSWPARDTDPVEEDPVEGRAIGEHLKEEMGRRQDKNSSHNLKNNKKTPDHSELMTEGLEHPIPEEVENSVIMKAIESLKQGLMECPELQVPLFLVFLVIYLITMAFGQENPQHAPDAQVPKLDCQHPAGKHRQLLCSTLVQDLDHTRV